MNASILTGAANAGIAKRLGLSVRTVENYRAQAYVKLQVNSLEQLLGLYAELSGIRRE